MSDDAYSEWLKCQIAHYIELSTEPSLSDDALMYFAGMRDGLTRANIHYHEEKQR